MKKRILAMIFAAFMAMSMVGCGGSENSSTADSGSDVAQEETEGSAAKETENTKDTDGSEDADVTYQSILDDYTAQIEAATPGLVDEYNEESADLSGDLDALAELSNSKVEELAKICNDGVEEMAELMQSNGDEYDTYEEWAGKLQDVYTEYSQEITDAYMNSAT